MLANGDCGTSAGGSGADGGGARAAAAAAAAGAAAQPGPQEQQQQQQEEDDEDDAPAPPPPRAACDVCRAQPHKYKCPGCGARTCGLACVAAHKQASRCSGRRDRLAFVPLADFGDRELISDYRLLEEVARADDNAKRHRPPAARPQLPQALAGLVAQARARGVRLLLMPPGMGRRRESTTYYDFRARRLLWRLEWAFPEADAAAVAAMAAQQAQQEQEGGGGVSGGDKPGGGGGGGGAPRRWAPTLPVAKRRRAEEGAAAAAAAAAAGDGTAAAPATAAAASAPAAPDDAAPPRLVLVDARADEDRPLRPLLEAHLAAAPGAGARRLALHAYTAAVEAAGGDVGALAVLMKREPSPVSAPAPFPCPAGRCDIRTADLLAAHHLRPHGPCTTLTSPPPTPQHTTLHDPHSNVCSAPTTPGQRAALPPPRCGRAAARAARRQGRDRVPLPHRCAAGAGRHQVRARRGAAAAAAASAAAGGDAAATAAARRAGAAAAAAAAGAAAAGAAAAGAAAGAARRVHRDWGC